MAELVAVLLLAIAAGAITLAVRRGPRLSPPSPAAPQVLLRVAVPPDTAWSPPSAEQLIRALLSLPHGLALRIHAHEGVIGWELLVPEPEMDQIRKTVLAFAPCADITVAAPYSLEHVVVYRLHTTAPFYVPLATADELKALDPLVGLAGAMSNMAPGEHVVYQVKLLPMDDHRWAGDGERALARCNDGFPLVAPHRAPGYARAPCTPEGHRLCRDKLTKPLARADLTLVIRAATPDRTHALGRALLTGLLPFAREAPIPNALTPAVRGATPPVLSPPEIAALWHLPTIGCRSAGIRWATGLAAPLPAALTGVAAGVLLGYHTHQGRTQPVYLGDADRLTHLNLVGRTRTGKSTAMHHLIHHDIAGGHGVALIDPHGDLVQAVLTGSIPAEREDDVLVLDLADLAYPVALNLLAVPDGGDRHAGVTATLSVLKRLYAGQWTSRMEDALYNALAALTCVRGATLRHLPPLFLDPDFRAAVLNGVDDELVLEYWRQEYGRLTDRAQREVAQPVLHRLRAFFRNPALRRLVCQPGTLDFRAIMAKRKILLVRLPLGDVHLGPEAATLGALLITQLQLAAMSRFTLPPAARPPYFLFCDEVQHFTTTALSTLLSEAAKYGVVLTIAHQYLAQLEGETLEAVLGNTGTTILFRLGRDDAQRLAPVLRPAFEAAHLTQLDRFQAVVLMQKDGKTLPPFPITTQPPLAQPTGGPTAASRIIAKSRAVLLARGWASPASAVDAGLATTARGGLPRPPISDYE